MATSPKKTSSRKASARNGRAAATQPARAARTSHEEHKAAAGVVHPKDRMLATALSQLPEGFNPEGFEVVGDQVRIYGKVHGRQSQIVGFAGDANAVPAPLPRGPYPEPPRETLARNSVVFDSLHLIGRRIDEAWNALDALEIATGSILVPPPAAGDAASAGKDPQPVESPAVSLMNDLARGLERLTNRINHITGRAQA